MSDHQTGQHQSQPWAANPSSHQGDPSQGGWGQHNGGRPPLAQEPPVMNEANLLKRKDPTPGRGWRKAVHKATFGAVNPGPSPEEIREIERVRLIRTPVRGCHQIAVASLKGGVGKTTTAACLGLALATCRGDGVVALDANPDAGTLAERLVGPLPDPTRPLPPGVERTGTHYRMDDGIWVSPFSARHMLSGLGSIRAAADMHRYTSLTGRLHVIASDQDPEISEAFDETQYRTVAQVVSAFYSVMLTDSGTGILHSAMAGTLALANTLVVVAAPSVDGARRAAKTLDWLHTHGHSALASQALTIICHPRPSATEVDVDSLRDHFAGRCRAVLEVPFDSELVGGGIIRWEQLRATTRDRYLELAAHIAVDFAKSWQ